MPHFSKASDIKVGVVGYSVPMPKIHLTQAAVAGMKPTAVAEINPERLQAASVDFPGIELYSDLDTMLKKSGVNLIVLITPHNTHAPLAIKCLKAGRHVICEKPLAITTADVDTMISAARKSGVVLSTYHNRHWDGRILEAMRRIKKERAIGDIVRIECHMGGYNKPRNFWRASRTMSGGILYDWGVHLLEYSLQLIESPMTEVSGFAHHGYWAPHTDFKLDTNEDEGYIVVRFKSGQWLTLMISAIDSKAKEGWVEITGTKGSYVIDQDHSKILSHVTGDITTIQFKNPPDEWQRYYNHVRDHLVKGKPLVITPEWSRRPIHILDLGVRSAKLGRSLPAKHS